MKGCIEQILLPMRVFIIESNDHGTDTPILLYLHGRGEASRYENALPLVCNHLSPPFQAILGRLTDVIVVAPQAPRDPEDGCNWRTYVTALGLFLKDRFRQRKILATGFSRGGLGVLQLRREFPDLITQWAIVDPQRAADDTEEKKLIPVPSPHKQGWLRYGDGIPQNKPFSESLAANLESENVRFVRLDHGDLALAAYKGDKLDGNQNLYEFLGLNYSK